MLGFISLITNAEIAQEEREARGASDAKNAVPNFFTRKSLIFLKTD
jgi:hypothetical protein